MAIRLEQNFIVKAPPETVWAYLTDPHRVAAALPGAQLTGQADERTYHGTITVRVGPVSPSFRGVIRFERLDERERTAEIVATGQGLRGVGNAELRMVGRVEEEGAGASRVSMSSEVSVTGILAQFGRGLIEQVSNRMLRQFVETMRSELEDDPSRSPGSPDRGRP